MEGWIKIHRKILDWEWFDDDKTFKLFIYFLFTANYEDKKWHGITIPRGSIVTSLNHLSEKMHVSVRSIRTSINRLKSTHEVTCKTTNKFTIVTVCKYDNYQTMEDDKRQAERQAERQTNDKQTTNKRQQLKNIKNIYKETTTNVVVKKDASKDATLSRKDSFYNSLIPFVDKYSKDTIRKFFDYWSELNKSETKMRFELEKTWELSKRLSMWVNREKIPNKKTNIGIILNDNSIEKYENENDSKWNR